MSTMKIMSSSSQPVVKIDREKVVACMTCPLCKKLFSEATTISECLHTFCRKCIYDKIIDEELNCCPVCKTDLGVSPLDKLRTDNSLQDIKAKLFPPERKKRKAPVDHNVQHMRTKNYLSEIKKVEAPAVPSVPLPAKRKERYLSSLELSTPGVSTRSGMSGRRRYPTRKSLPQRSCSLSIQEPVRKEEDCLERLNSPETLKKDALFKRQVKEKYTAESSKQRMLNNRAEDNAQPGDEKTDLWRPLNCLVEAASKEKPDIFKVPADKPVLRNAHNNETHELKATKEHGNKSKVHVNENESNPVPSGSVTVKKAQRGRKRRAAVSEGFNIPAHNIPAHNVPEHNVPAHNNPVRAHNIPVPAHNIPVPAHNIPAQFVVDANNKFERRFNPIWFSLIASNQQEGYAPLPQIPSCFLRIKDVSLPVSFIKKYLVRKLGLNSEAEVEILLCGRPIIPTLQLHHLVDLWLQTAPGTQKIHTSVGSSAKDFVMVLTYGRKMYPW